MAELKRAKVKLLVDTRAVAASRKPGFSKRQLAATLDENGIAYLHLQKLGTPDEGRQAARAGKLDTLWRIYAKHLKTPEAIEAMEELIAIVKSGQVVCLLCYEREKDCCHRTRIAEIVHSAPARASSIWRRNCSERLLGGLNGPGFSLDAVDEQRHRRSADQKADRDHRRRRQHQIEAAAAVQERDHGDGGAGDHIGVK